MARCASCGSEQEHSAIACKVCGALMMKRQDEQEGVLHTESGERAVKMLLWSLAALLVFAVIGLITVWYATYRISRGRPFTMERPTIVQPLNVHSASV